MAAPRTPLGPISSNIIRRKELNPILRAQICTAAQWGASVAEIEQTYSVPSSTVKGTLERAAHQIAYASKPRTGRPSKVTARDRRIILRIARRNPKITYKQLQKEAGVPYHRNTIYHVLKQHGITNWRAQKRPKLTDEHARLRLAFAQLHVNFTDEQWFQYIFSDECSVERGKGKAREWVFRTPSQKWDKEMISEFEKGKGVCVMVWGAIYNDCEMSDLVVMRRDPLAPKGGYSANLYCDTLDEGLIPIIYDDGGDELVFMQDNAPIHKSRKAMRWFQNHGVQLLADWPPYSPDMNPIEHLWPRLKEAIYHINPQFDEITGIENQRTALEEILPQAWRSIKTETVRAVLGSMKARMEAVIKADGWQTKY